MDRRVGDRGRRACIDGISITASAKRLQESSQAGEQTVDSRAEAQRLLNVELSTSHDYNTAALTDRLALHFPEFY